MKVDILFVANNPGSFNALFPVLKECVRHGLNCECFIVDFGKDLLKKEKIAYSTLNETLNENKISKTLKTLFPKVLISGTSLKNTKQGNVENLFRKEAKKLNIYSVSILDHWVNYRQRFSSNNSNRLDCLPDKICVMDEMARDEMINEGIPEDIIEITGNPYFDRLLNIKKKLSSLKKNELREKLHLPEDHITITFISEPIAKDHGIESRGYDEYVVLNDLLSTRELQCLNQFNKKIDIVIKRHPRESAGKFKEYFSKFKWSVTEFNKDDIYILLASSDLIIGMTSILLIEAHLLGYRCVSYQPDPIKNIMLPFQIKVIDNYLDLGVLISESLFKKPSSEMLGNYIISHDATNRIIDILFKELKIIGKEGGNGNGA